MTDPDPGRAELAALARAVLDPEAYWAERCDQAENKLEALRHMAESWLLEAATKRRLVTEDGAEVWEAMNFARSSYAQKVLHVLDAEPEDTPPDNVVDLITFH